MRPFAIAAALFLGACAAAPQDASLPMPMPTQSAEHKWLEQLVGAWTVTSEATMEPGASPQTMESTEDVRSLGGLWILAEGQADFDGTPFTSMMTLGYDPQRKGIVGTWIDTAQTYLWSYKGTLDESTNTLTLEAEGPSFGDPAKMAKYRDVIEMKDADRRILTSSVQEADGGWTTFLRAEYVRKQ